MAGVDDEGKGTTMDGTEASTADFEPLSGTLLLDKTDFDELVELVTDDQQPTAWNQRWHATGLVSSGQLEPVVEAMATVSADAVRQLVVERVIAGAADELLAAWDPSGRVVMMRRVIEHRIAVQLTSFELLPTLLGQHLRLLRSTEPTPTERQPIDSTTDTINAMLDPNTKPPPTDGPVESQELAGAIGTVQLGWRISAGWVGKDPDISLIGINTSTGHWLAGQQSGTARIVPITAATAIDQLGNAVSGNNHKPAT